MNRARLIPVHGIGSAKEAEQRAASALLAILTVVRDLSVELLSPLGASRAQKATVEAFTEVEYKVNGKKWRPDGLVVVTYGKSTWSTLVEIKTGSDELTADQVNAYWDIAREQGYDHVLTISNEIAPKVDSHPTSGLKVRSNSKVGVSHRSWTSILTSAITLKQHKGVDDPEQAYLLSELIRYLEHPRSGALAFEDMGPNWTIVREAVRNVGATPRDEGIDDICARWDQLLRFAALQLGARLGEDVSIVHSRVHQDPARRQRDLMEQLARDGVLTGALRVPDTVGDIAVLADLRARQLQAMVDVPAPMDKQWRGRVGWLLRQLGDAPAQTLIEAWPKNARSGHTASLARAREERELLVPDGKEPFKFRVALRSEMGLNRSNGGKRAGFVESVIGLIDTFYEQVIQDITPWQPSAPQAKKTTTSESDDPGGEAIRQSPAPVLVDGD